MRRPWMTVVAAALIPAGAQAQMKAHFINVGQGQAVLLEFQTTAVLVDAGGEPDDADRQHLIGWTASSRSARTWTARSTASSSHIPTSTTRAT